MMTGSCMETLICVFSILWRERAYYSASVGILARSLRVRHQSPANDTEAKTMVS